MERLKELFVCINRVGTLLAGEKAIEEVRDFPDDIVWSGTIKNVHRVDELARLAVDAAHCHKTAH